MNIIFLFSGLISGGLLTYFIFNFVIKTKTVSKNDYDNLLGQNNSIDTALKIAEEKIRKLDDDLGKTSDKLENKEKQYSEIISKSASDETTIINLNQKISELRQEIQESGNVVKNLQNELTILRTDNAGFKANTNYLNEKLENEKKLIEETKKGFQLEFENIANKILEDKTKRFTETNKTNIEGLLKPFDEQVKEFRKKVEEETKERFSLGQKVKELVELNNSLRQEANNLTTALRGQAKKQGNWGEIILESILDKSGLEKGREYILQETVKDDSGKNLRPDVIIHLPDKRSIIIDSKVSLNAYERYSSSEIKEEQDKNIQEHLRSIRNHIDELSNKHYEELVKDTLDFVMMFVPIEPAYFVAVQNDPDLWLYAYNKRILLISPTNLIAALKLVADLWKREQQNRNALEIAKQGGRLYEKFAGFLETLEDIGKQISKTHLTYDKAVSQLKDGRGNIISQALKLKNLGLKPQKHLPSVFTPDINEDENENEDNNVEITENS